MSNDVDRTTLTRTAITGEGTQGPLRMRLPGFISDEDVGLGDFIMRTTSYVGIKPCGGCERRAATFNRWLLFTR
jgi:hypothetical protein